MVWRGADEVGEGMVWIGTDEVGGGNGVERGRSSRERGWCGEGQIK